MNQPCIGLEVTITTKTFHEKVVYGDNDNSGGVFLERVVTNPKSTRVVPKATQNTQHWTARPTSRKGIGDTC